MSWKGKQEGWVKSSFDPPLTLITPSIPCLALPLLLFIFTFFLSTSSCQLLHLSFVFRLLLSLSISLSLPLPVSLSLYISLFFFSRALSLVYRWSVVSHGNSFAYPSVFLHCRGPYYLTWTSDKAFQTSLFCQWGKEYADCISCRGVRLPQKGYPEYVTKLHPTVWLHFWSAKEWEEILHCHYSHLHSDSEW